MSLFSELKRRQAFLAGAAYVVTSVLILVILFLVVQRMMQAPQTDSAGHVNAQEGMELPAVITEKSVAVLPFTNRNPADEDSRLFSEGLQHDLGTALSTISGLQVISSASSRALRNTKLNLQQIGIKLGVALVIQGEAHRARNRIVVNVRLVHVESGESLWSGAFDREFNTTDFFQIQGEIAQTVAAVLQTGLSAQDMTALYRAPTSKLGAYRAVLRAREFQQSHSPASAARLARKAITLDPAYADAHLLLAGIHTRTLGSGLPNDAGHGEEIRTAINSAMNIRPDYGLAFAALGLYQHASGAPGWEESFATAMQLDPGNVQTPYDYGLALHRSGQPLTASPLLIQASQRDPLAIDKWYALGQNHAVLGNFESARNAFERIREIDPDSPLAYLPTSASYVYQGQLHTALHWLQRAIVSQPSNLELGGWILYLNDCLENYETAHEWSNWLDQGVTKQAQPLALQARHHFLTGNFQLAIQIANRVLKLGLPDRWGSDAIIMRIKRDEALANGDPEAGLEVFRQHRPELFQARPDLTAENVQQAVDLAQLLQLAGQPDQSDRLLDAALDYYQQPWSTAGPDRAWLLPVKAEALAIRGDNEAALAELQRIIELGWRINWRWETELNFNFNGIRRTAEFFTMVEYLTRDMETQRDQVYQLAAEGKILPPPAWQNPVLFSQ